MGAGLSNTATWAIGQEDTHSPALMDAPHERT
jgi:hypothetical protein